MKAFEFPEERKRPEEPRKEKDLRGAGGGFFAGFNQATKSKMAKLTKEEREET